MLEEDGASSNVRAGRNPWTRPDILHRNKGSAPFFPLSLGFARSHVVQCVSKPGEVLFNVVQDGITHDPLQTISLLFFFHFITGVTGFSDALSPPSAGV